MKGDAKIIQSLNLNLKLEITAINQLFLHSRISKNWGLNNLANFNYKASLVAMNTADSLIARILFLQGLPNLQDIGKILIGETVEEMISCDLMTMIALRQQYLDSIALCESQTDFESRFLIMPALDLTEEHIDWLESQQWLIESMGIENYTQAQIEDETQ